MHSRLGSATLSQLAFPGESNPNFPWEKSHWNNTVLKSGEKKEDMIHDQLKRNIKGAKDRLVPNKTLKRRNGSFIDELYQLQSYTRQTTVL